MLGEQLQHVVEKADARLHRVAAGAVEMEVETDVRLLRLAGHCGAATFVPRRSAASLECHQRDPPTRRRRGASRRSIVRACASSPSSRASRATAGPSRARVRGPASMRLVRLMKSYTPSGEAKR